MYKKYISFSLLVFSLNIYSSQNQLVLKRNNINPRDIEEIERNLNALLRSQASNNPQEETFFYQLPSTTQPAQRVISGPTEIAQQRSASATNMFSKMYRNVVTTLVNTQLTLSLAEAAKHGHFPDKASQDIETFTQDLQNETTLLLSKFQNNNQKYFEEESQINRKRIQENQTTLHDLNAILANLPTIDSRYLQSKSLQFSIDRSLKNIETKLQEQLEVNKLKTEKNLQEISDLTKYLQEVNTIRSQLCTTNNNTDFSELMKQYDIYFSTKK